MKFANMKIDHLMLESLFFGAGLPISMTSVYAQNTSSFFKEDPIESFIVRPDDSADQKVSIAFSNPETATALFINRPLNQLNLKGGQISCRLSHSDLQPFLEAVVNLCPSSARARRMLDSHQQQLQQPSQDRVQIAAP